MNADRFRLEILDFLESLRVPDGPYGRYRYAACQDRPILYASCYAALGRHLLSALDDLSDPQRTEWREYILSFQAEDGLFKEEALAHPGSWYVPPHMEWCGWWHLSCHVIMALTPLDAVPRREFAFLRTFYDEARLRRWLADRDFGRIAFVGNEVMNLGMLLQYARDFQHEKRAARAMEIVLDWLDETQDPATGLWGAAFETPDHMNDAYQAAYHFLPLYDYDRRPVRYPERILDSMLSMQTPQGGFGIHENTSGCEDIDAIDPIARMTTRTDHRRADAVAALRRAIDWVLENRTGDGGFCFIKDADFFYGSDCMFSRAGEGSSFCAWWRTLSLAYACRVVTDHELARVPWRFLDCPGYQVGVGAV